MVKISNKGTSIRNDFGSFVRKFDEDLKKAAENFRLFARRTEAGMRKFETNWIALVGNFSGAQVARLYGEHLRKNNVQGTAQVMDELADS